MNNSVFKSVDELLKSADNSALPSIATSASAGRSVLSFGIVNSEGNGKRITLSKSLANALDVDKSIDLLLVPDDGKLLIAKGITHEKKITRSLSDKGGQKLAYTAPVVALLIECFSLDFGKHVSQSFQNIRIDKLPDGTPLAIVDMTAPKPYSNDVANNIAPKDEVHEA